MTRLRIICAAFLIVAAGTPAFSQMQHGAMSRGSATPTSSMRAPAADIDAMMRCKKMTPQAMMKNKSCAAMMKAHPKMMKMPMGDMKMMKSCQRMSHGAMMGNRGCATMIRMHPDMMNMRHGMTQPD